MYGAAPMAAQGEHCDIRTYEKPAHLLFCKLIRTPDYFNISCQEITGMAFPEFQLFLSHESGG